MVGEDNCADALFPYCQGLGVPDDDDGCHWNRGAYLSSEQPRCAGGFVSCVLEVALFSACHHHHVTCNPNTLATVVLGIDGEDT